MFNAPGPLYYPVGGARHLYSRSFRAGSDPADDIVGAQVLVASGDGDGLDWSRVRGITAAGDHIYWSEGADLHRIDFAGGTPKAGTATVVGPEANFDARGLFFLPPGGPGGPAA